jgi:ATP-binding cassette subfamily C protein CydD
VKPLDPRLLKYAGAARAFFVTGALLGAVSTASIVAFCFLLSQIVVRAIAGDSVESLAPMLAGLAGVVVVRSIVTWLLDWTSARAGATVKSQLRRRLLAAIVDLGPAWLSRRNATAVATVTGNGLDSLDSYFSRYLPQLILTVIATPVIVVVMLVADLPSGISVLLTLPIIPVFMVLIGWATQAVQKKQWDSLQRLSSGFLDVVGGLATLKLFGRQHRQVARIRTVTDGYRSETMKVLRISFLSGFALELAASLSVALVAVSVGIRLIDGSLGLSVGLFVLLLAPEAFLPLRGVGTQFHNAAEGVAASEHVFEILDEAERMPVAGSPTSAAAPPAVAWASGPAELQRIGVLSLEDVGVEYDGIAAVSGFSGAFAAGELSVITGPSGAGKSSLIAAMLGFVAHSGRIALDGVSASSAGASADWVAWTGQRPGLVSGTVLENVGLGSATPDRMLASRALALAAAEEIDLDLPLGIAGSGLSGGQAQRVGIARAVYRSLERGSAVVLLDEPTSALDSATESHVIAGLRVLAGTGRIVIVVSHRPGVIAASDARITLETSVGAVL